MTKREFDTPRPHLQVTVAHDGSVQVAFPAMEDLLNGIELDCASCEKWKQHMKTVDTIVAIHKEMQLAAQELITFMRDWEKLYGAAHHDA